MYLLVVPCLCVAGRARAFVWGILRERGRVLASCTAQRALLSGRHGLKAWLDFFVGCYTLLGSGWPIRQSANNGRPALL